MLRNWLTDTRFDPWNFKTKDMKVVKGQVSSDNVHIFVSVPPHIFVSQLAQSLKGKTS
jgi:putative transposase